MLKIILCDQKFCMHITTYSTNSGTPMNFINTSLQNDNGQIKKEIIIKVIIHEI